VLVKKGERELRRHAARSSGVADAISAEGDAKEERKPAGANPQK